MTAAGEQRTDLVEEVVADLLVRGVLREAEVDHLGARHHVERVAPGRVAHPLVFVVRHLVQQLVPVVHECIRHRRTVSRKTLAP